MPLPPSDLLGSGYAQRAVEAARHTAQAVREADELEVARAAEDKAPEVKDMAEDPPKDGGHHKEIHSRGASEYETRTL